MFKSLKQFAKKLAGGSKRTRKVSQKGGATKKVGKLNIEAIQKGITTAAAKSTQNRIGQIKHNRTHGRKVGKGSMPNPNNSRNVKEYGNSWLKKRNSQLYSNGTKLNTWQKKRMSEKFGAKKGQSRKNHTTGSNIAYFATQNEGNTAYNVLGKKGRDAYAYANNMNKSNGNLKFNNRGAMNSIANENFYAAAMQNQNHYKQITNRQKNRTPVEYGETQARQQAEYELQKRSSPRSSPRKSSRKSSPPAPPSTNNI